ncbi:MAG: phosphonate metabolism protein/1,5-bisphosphokinase (PRPP-forming) PhnN [Alphaproteobacteria bacterium]
MPGCFIGVVGPSGAGKDSLIDAARVHFGPDGPIRFVRRCITRPAEAGGEDHLAVDDETFIRLQAQGAFALDWAAHGLRYGIPADIGETLSEGRAVLANLSRGVIDTVRQRFERRRIIVVTADPSILAERLAGRGRESAAEISERLARAPYEMPDGPDVTIVQNNGALIEAERDFRAALYAAL